MPSISIPGVFATYVAEATSFELANNALGTTTVFTNTRPADNYAIGGYESSTFGVGGQSVIQTLDGSPQGYSLLYRVYQPIFKFEIPIFKIKELLSAYIGFSAHQGFRNNITTRQANTYRIRAVPNMKRYAPVDMVNQADIDSIVDGGYRTVNILNPANYINQVNFFIGFSELSQELNLSRITTPLTDSSGNPIDGNVVDITTFQNVTLYLDFVEYTASEARAKFKHFNFAGSGVVEMPGGGLKSIYPFNSGFVERDVQEDVGAVLLYSGSGHQLRQFSISCYDKLITFLNPESDYSFELKVAPEHTGQGVFNLCQWYTTPTQTGYSSRNFSVIRTFAATGGNYTFSFGSFARWFHIEQYDPQRRRVVPVRLEERDGKLYAVGF